MRSNWREHLSGTCWGKAAPVQGDGEEFTTQKIKMFPTPRNTNSCNFYIIVLSKYNMTLVNVYSVKRFPQQECEKKNPLYKNNFINSTVILYQPYL